MRTYFHGIMVLLLGMGTLIQAETVVDLEFIRGGGTADLVPARALDVNNANEATVAWSDSVLLFDGPDAKNLDVYGAFTVTGAGVVGGADLEVQDSPADTADYLRFDGLKSAAGNQTCRVIAFWDSADFRVSGFRRFDASAGSSLTLGINAFANAGGGGGVRFVIRDGSRYYVSSFTTTTTASIDGTTAGLQWGEFNVNDWASFDNDNADAGMGVAFVDKTFDNVTGVGFIAEIKRPNAIGTAFRVDDFRATLVQETKTLGLITWCGQPFFSSEGVLLV